MTDHNQSGARPRGQTQAILLGLQTPDRDDAAVARSAEELASLAAGLGMAVTTTVVQRLREPATQTWLGEGKLREIAALTGGSGEVPRGPAPPVASDADLVVLADDELTPAQRRNLEGALGVAVLDRTEIILRVFEARATSRASRLSVELARLQVELPRIRDDHSIGDREGGGGRAARGASNVELAKDRMRTRMAAIRAELAALAPLPRDRGDGPFRVALVGYTNAGKSTLMRALTGSEVLVKDQLFATLATTTRPLVPPSVPPVLLVDSVGFLDRLPHRLIASFRSTLAEARDADLLLLVVDASDEAAERQLAVTRETLAEIEADALPCLLVGNKADRLQPEARAAWLARHPDSLLVSAYQPAEVTALRAAVLTQLTTQLETAVVTLPWAAAGILAAARGELQVLEQHAGEALTATVRGQPAALARLQERLRTAGADRYAEGRA